jgi:hypothetical protein
MENLDTNHDILDNEFPQAETEEPTKSVERFLQFSCYIDKDVKYLHTGLKNRLSKCSHIT